jgi:hypothetical protein
MGIIGELMQRIILLIVFGTTFLFAFKNDNKSYPQDFASPVNFPIKLSGTFAELRPNHYHGGIDIKPQKRNHQGDAILSIGEGYISRIVVSAHGYGNALYVTHPNGYTSLYAHLQKFVPRIATYVEAKHYELESFELDIQLSSEILPVFKGEQIGYLGTTGHSFGPHLHFEIRDTKSQQTINPLLFGFEVSDTKKPMMQSLKVYELNYKNEVERTENYGFKMEEEGVYNLLSDTIQVASNRMAVGIKVFDNISGTSNPNGIYALSIFQEDSLIYDFDMEVFDNRETRYLNAHSDYNAWQNGEGHYYRGYRLKGNLQQNLFNKLENDGIIRLSKTPKRIKIIAKDLVGNESVLEFFAKRSMVMKDSETKIYNYILPYNEGSIIKRKNLELYFEDSSFYETVYMNIYEIEDSSSEVFSSTFHIGEEEIPIHRPYEIRVKPHANFDGSLKSKLYIGRCKNGRTSYVGGTWKGGWLTAKSRTFDDYVVLLDTIAPTITPLEFNGVKKPSPRLSFKLSDKGTGIQSYNAWVDGKWILMKYDGKKNVIYHTFDEKIPTGTHSIRIVISDLRGNTTVFESAFIR